MIWKGLNRRADPTDLQPGQLPDQSNCEHRDGVVGVLGPRPGVLFTNASPFTSLVRGLIPFTLPNRNRRILVAQNDGRITDEAAPFPTEAVPSYPGSVVREFTTGANLTLTTALPDQDVEATAEFSGSATYTKETAELAQFEYPVNISWSTDVSNDTLSIFFGLKKSGGNVYAAGAHLVFDSVGVSGWSTAGLRVPAVFFDPGENGPFTGIAIKARSSEVGATVSIIVTIPGNVIFR